MLHRIIDAGYSASLCGIVPLLHMTFAAFDNRYRRKPPDQNCFFVAVHALVDYPVLISRFASFPSECLKLLLVIFRSLPASSFMSLGYSSNRSVISWRALQSELQDLDLVRLRQIGVRYRLLAVLPAGDASSRSSSCPCSGGMKKPPFSNSLSALRASSFPPTFCRRRTPRKSISVDSREGRSSLPCCSGTRQRRVRPLPVRSSSGSCRTLERCSGPSNKASDGL